MSRCLLQKKKLEAFCAWLDGKKIDRRGPRGEYQVIQIKTRSGQWHAIFDRLNAPEHYTVAWPLESIVRRFIRDSKESS